MGKIKLRKGDKVIVRTGSDKGKTGKIKQVLPEKERVVVDGVNVVKRHQKPTNKDPKGGIFEEERPIHISNVGLVHPDDDSKASRIGYKEVKGEKKRVYRQANGKVVK